RGRAATGQRIPDHAIRDVPRRDGEVHPGRVPQWLDRRHRRGPCAGQVCRLHRQVGQCVVAVVEVVVEVEESITVAVAELEEPHEALAEDREYGEGHRSKVVVTRVVDLRATEEPLVLREDIEVVWMVDGPVNDPEAGVPRSNGDPIAAAESVRRPLLDDWR